MNRTCEYCGLTYSPVAYWHCPSPQCIERRTQRDTAFVKRVLFTPPLPDIGNDDIQEIV